MRAALLCLMIGCAGSSRPASRSPSPRTPPQAAAEAIGATCGDLARFRRALLAEAPPEVRPALTRWAPPRPVAAGDRGVITAAVNRYLSLCGLDETVALTRALVAFPTVSASEPPADGPSFAAMARFLADWSREAGLTFRIVGANDAWQIGLHPVGSGGTTGTGATQTDLVMHADVVPVQGEGVAAPAAPNAAAPATTAATTAAAPLPAGWTSAPFEARVIGDRLYGRGTEDDKGPIAAALVILRVLAKAGLQPRAGSVRVVLGTAEESNWDGMERYVAQEPRARHVISVDANFPVVVAESGFVAYRLGARDPRPVRGTRRARIVSAEAGLFLTQVPAEARMTLAPGAGESASTLLERVRAAGTAEAARGGTFRVEAREEAGQVLVLCTGNAVHSSVANEGDNALWLLSGVASRLDLEAERHALILRLVHEALDGDHWGDRLGLAYEHPLMGRLLVAPTMLRDHDGVAELRINMRRPAGLTSAQFQERLAAALAKLRRTVSPRIEVVGTPYVGEPAVADTSGPLAATLLEIYRHHSGDPSAAPISIRGGTYARLFEGAVSFGPSLPGRPYRGHAPDEYIELEALRSVLAMLFDAVIALDVPSAD